MIFHLTHPVNTLWLLFHQIPSSGVINLTSGKLLLPSEGRVFVSLVVSKLHLPFLELRQRRKAPASVLLHASARLLCFFIEQHDLYQWWKSAFERIRPSEGITAVVACDRQKEHESTCVLCLSIQDLSVAEMLLWHMCLQSKLDARSTLQMWQNIPCKTCPEVSWTLSEECYYRVKIMTSVFHSLKTKEIKKMPVKP